jgi:hypothetical protein
MLLMKEMQKEAKNSRRSSGTQAGLIKKENAYKFNADGHLDVALMQNFIVHSEKQAGRTAQGGRK